MKKLSTLLFGAGIAASTMTNAQIQLNRIGGYETGVFDEGAAEIVSYNASNNYLYSVNSNDVTVDIISLIDPTSPVKVKSIDLTTAGAGANAVAVGDDFFVVAIENANKQADGKLVFFNLNGDSITEVPAGALPDNVNISPDGNYVVAANEGEPSDDYTVDPEGSVTIVDISNGIDATLSNNTLQINLQSYNGKGIEGAIVNHNPGSSTVAQDLEPEYVAFNSTSTEAMVVCQENNAVIKINLASGTNSILDTIIGLGFKDWSATNGFDASNKSKVVDFKNWNVFGVYQPDASVGKNIGGVEYLFTANEGDGRDYDGFEGEARVKDLALNTSVFSMTDIQNDTLLGRLKVHVGPGLNPVTNEYDSLFAYGARSFSIWNANDMSLVYDSESIIEEKVFEADPVNFNSTNDETAFKNRSDDKGPEPEAIAVGMVGAKYYAFVGLERHGGVMTFDVTDVNNVSFVDFTNNRNFDVDPTTSAAGDLAPECIIFIPQADNNHGKDLIVVANEVSGTISVFEIVETSTYTSNISGNQFSIFPNPTSGTLNVSKAGDYEIFDFSGKLVKNVVNSNIINVSDLANGIYTIKSATESMTFIVK